MTLFVGTVAGFARGSGLQSWYSALARPEFFAAGYSRRLQHTYATGAIRQTGGIRAGADQQGASAGS